MPSRIDPRVVLERTKLPHVAYFGFGAKLAVLLQGVTDPDSLGYALNSIAKLIESRLADLSSIVQEAAAPATVTRPPASLAPVHDSWIAAVHHDGLIVGPAVVVDQRRLLTAVDVISSVDRPLMSLNLSVTFPKAAVDRHYRVHTRFPKDRESNDVAVLYLDEPSARHPTPTPARPGKCPCEVKRAGRSGRDRRETHDSHQQPIRRDLRRSQRPNSRRGSCRACRSPRGRAGREPWPAAADADVP